MSTKSQSPARLQYTSNAEPHVPNETRGQHRKLIRAASLATRLLAGTIIIISSLVLEPFDSSHKVELQDVVESEAFVRRSGSARAWSSAIVVVGKAWAASCLRWDAFHFLNIARNARWAVSSMDSKDLISTLGIAYEYQFEYEYAFMPGVPLVMKLGAHAWSWISELSLPGEAMAEIPVYYYLLSGAVIAVVCDPTWPLYKYVLTLAREKYIFYSMPNDISHLLQDSRSATRNPPNLPYSLPCYLSSPALPWLGFTGATPNLSMRSSPSADLYIAIRGNGSAPA